jgi:ubiquinone/menaquinone biosynthesis C-methylase UbiE
VHQLVSLRTLPVPERMAPSLTEPMDHNPIAVRVFNAWAQGYNEAFMDTSLYHASFDLFCDAIAPPKAEVLELACGPGNITRYLLTKRPDLRILGTDLAPNMLELARKNNPGASFQLMDARKVHSLGRTFDGIMCGFCLPYLTPHETTALIQDASEVLRPGGVLYLSTMEDDPARSGFKPSSTGQGESAYIQYYEGRFLTQTLEANGFTVLHLDRKAYAGRDGSLTTDVLIVAKR